MHKATWINRGIGTALLTMVIALPASAQNRVPAPPKPQVLPDASGRIPTSPGLTPQTIPEILPEPVMKSGFGIPEGLATDPDILFSNLGLGSPRCFPLTPISCFDVGYQCYSRGYFRDALAFADHGLKLCNHACLYLLKAVCEMHLGRCDNAASSIGKYRSASTITQETIGLGPARERINDPMRVRLEYLLAVPK